MLRAFVVIFLYTATIVGFRESSLAARLPGLHFHFEIVGLQDALAGKGTC